MIDQKGDKSARAATVGVLGSQSLYPVRITEIDSGMTFTWITSSVRRRLASLKRKFPWIESRFHGIRGGRVLVNDKGSSTRIYFSSVE